MTQLSRREFTLASALLAMDGVVRPAFAATTPSAAPPGSATDPFAYVNAELRPTLQELEKKYPPMEWSAKTLPAMRKMNESFSSPPQPTPVITERRIPGPTGAPDVRVYIIGASASASPRPAVLHTHGGGYVSGAAAQGLSWLQQVATTQDCVVVSVDYRLAPETKFPGALEDNYAALRWLHTHAQELGVDRSRIALLGESAGGGHAAMLAIAARDRGEVPIAMQVLIYPMLDDRTGSTRAVPAHIGTFTWTAPANRFGWSSLLGVPAGSATVPRGSVPARIEKLAGLPPAFIGVGALDLFVQEDIAYAQRLIEAGVQTELYVVPGAFHGFDVIVPGATISKGFTAAWNHALTRRFRPQ